jgi:hypothetical protein
MRIKYMKLTNKFIKLKNKYINMAKVYTVSTFSLLSNFEY